MKNGTTFETYALLDDCSESTLIRSDVAKQLGHRMHAESIDLATIKGEDEESTDVHGMKLKISSIDGKFTVMIEEAYAVDRECFNMPSRPAFTKGEEQYDQLEGIVLDAVTPDMITVLIGADAPEAHIQNGVRRGKKGHPLAIQTGFGWTLFGASRGRAVHTAACYHLSSSLKRNLPSLWDEEPVRPPTVYVN